MRGSLRSLTVAAVVLISLWSTPPRWRSRRPRAQLHGTALRRCQAVNRESRPSHGLLVADSQLLPRRPAPAAGTLCKHPRIDRYLLVISQILRRPVVCDPAGMSRRPHFVPWRGGTTRCRAVSQVDDRRRRRRRRVFMNTCGEAARDYPCGCMPVF